MQLLRIKPNIRCLCLQRNEYRETIRAFLNLISAQLCFLPVRAATPSEIIGDAKFQVAAIAIVSGEECDGFCRSACQTVQFEDISPGPEIGDDDSIRRMNRIAEYSLSAKIADDRFPTSTPRYITKTWSFLSLAVNALETSTQLNNQNRTLLHPATLERTKGYRDMTEPSQLLHRY